MTLPTGLFCQECSHAGEVLLLTLDQQLEYLLVLYWLNMGLQRAILQRFQKVSAVIDVLRVSRSTNSLSHLYTGCSWIFKYSTVQ